MQIALLTLLLALASLASHAAEFQISDEGRDRAFEVVNESPASNQVQPKLAASPGIVLYEKGVERTPANRRVVTGRVLVVLRPGADARALAATYGITTGPARPYATNHFIFRAGSAAAALELAPRLRADPSVISAEPLLAHQRELRFAPNDLYFPDQWGLLNTGQNNAVPGVDINVTNVWETYRGKGVTVAVIDDGVKYTHPDLAAHYNQAIDYDYFDNDDTPLPSFNSGHGTSAAGIIGAVGNNSIGVTGVAFEATLVGIRLLGGPEGDDQEADSLTHSNQVIQIYSNGWGPRDDGRTLGGAGPLVLQAFKTGTSQGRGGKGSIFVWGSGNGGQSLDNANYDTYANSIYTIATGAVTDHGTRAAYSEPGACVVISGPGGRDPIYDQGIATVDLIGNEGFNTTASEGDYADLAYTREYGGTSASAPFVAGVVALMLQANPNLGWRDVQEILIRTAQKNAPLDAGWAFNSAGLHFNHNFGAGLVNAEAAVTLGKTWENLKAASSVVSHQDINPPIAIPDAPAAGITRTFDLSQTNLRIEQATLTVNIQHPFRGDLSIRLISPSGTVSRLAEAHADSNANIIGHKYMTVFNWGESSAGIWQVEIADNRPSGAGTLSSLELEVFGVPQETQVAPRLAVLNAAAPFQFTLQGARGRTYQLEFSPNLSNWQTLLLTNAPSAQLTVTDPSPPVNAPRFYRARALP